MFINNRLNKMLQASVFFALALTGESVMSLENPEYTVLYKDGKLEYRQYETYLVAETVVEKTSNYGDAGNEGFRRLFRYITGANTSQTKISMTAPVSQSAAAGEKISMTAPVQQSSAAAGVSVSFMLPSKYTLDSAPVPSDARVRVRAIPGELKAVLRYSGRWTERNYEEKKAELQIILKEQGVESLGAMQSALYNAPYTLPFMRRNEVMIAVDQVPEAVQMTKLVAY